MAFTDPKWFDSTYYMAQKLAQLQKTEPEKGWTADMVATAFAANGFVDQKDGSTAAYAHFTAFGAAEDVAPNQYFNAKVRQKKPFPCAFKKVLPGTVFGKIAA